MKPLWLINNIDDKKAPLIDAFKATGTDFKAFEFKNSHDTIDFPFEGTALRPVVLHGSKQFVEHIQKNYSDFVCPGAYGTHPENTKCSEYYPHIPQDILFNKEYFFTTWAEFCRNYQFYFDLFKATALFIRPNSGFKTFAGQPIYLNNVEDQIATLDRCTGVWYNTLILISSFKAFQANEYRFVVVENEVITGSAYNWDTKANKPEYPRECWHIANIVAKGSWQLDTAYVCDVVITPEGPKVLELNSFSCAGMYACDRMKIVEAVNKLAIKDYLELHGGNPI